MLQQRNANERIIGYIAVSHRDQALSNFIFCDEGLPGHDIRSLVPIQHPSEPILEQHRNIAQRRFQNEQIALRNARLVCRGFNMSVSDVVTTEPMPSPVSHSEIIDVAGEGAIGTITASDGSVLGQISIAHVTRGDLYRRAHNWLTDEARNVTIQTADLGLGRISGRYFFTVTRGDIYLISSTFTIDVHDARAQIRFENTILQRPIGSVLPIRVGNAVVQRDSILFEGRRFVRDGEAIFLQSIADLAHAELVIFTNTLISRITSPDW